MESTQTPDRIMFFGKERFFYHGLLGGEMKPRTVGAFSIYLAASTTFKIKIGNGDWQDQTVATVPQNTQHQIISDCGSIINIGIEPEHVADSSLSFIQRIVEDQSFDHKMLLERAARSKGTFACPKRPDHISTSDFDHLIFGVALDRKAIDPRIEKTFQLLDAELAENGLSAQHCAEAVQLSTSRFLHLFKENTGTAFRTFRMWKRARRFLQYANLDNSLTTVALDLGYPDSSHFSHSIRRIYGLKPRSIRDGSRKLKIFTD